MLLITVEIVGQIFGWVFGALAGRALGFHRFVAVLHADDGDRSGVFVDMFTLLTRGLVKMLHDFAMHRSETVSVSRIISKRVRLAALSILAEGLLVEFFWILSKVVWTWRGSLE